KAVLFGTLCQEWYVVSAIMLANKCRRKVVCTCIRLVRQPSVSARWERSSGFIPDDLPRTMLGDCGRAAVVRR
ncbi:MAG TPA: hypothetical protein VFD73_00375, partial [Gemmatimonadales bacterium]|nr:hypothetical protein [Gemmatimonadales bacterium]